MIFTQFNHSNNKDSSPIILIDNSGSTSARMTFGSDEGKSEKLSVLDYEIVVAHKILKERNIDSLYLMLWNSAVSFPLGQSSINLDALKNVKAVSGGGTALCTPLDVLPKDWYVGKEQTDLYIITDGEIQDNPGSLLRKYINLNFQIHIITVESHKSNYVNDNCQAGNSIYKILNKECLMKNVREFVSYNLVYLDGFVSINNPNKVIGYYTFRGEYFPVDQISQFVKHLETLIQKVNESGSPDQNLLLKLLHEISHTVSQMIEDKSLMIKKGIVNMISKLFIKTPLYKQCRKLLLNEAENIKNGQATTFQDYRRNRTKVFERAQMSLFDNVSTSIIAEDNDVYMSMIINNSILQGSVDKITGSISFGKDTYNKSAFVDGNFNIPILPTNVVMDCDQVDQCLRQWIRANYSRIHSVNVASDQILYYFLTDALRIHLSDINPTIKEAWKNMSRVMLDRVRFGTPIKEYDYLLDNNPPAPVSGSQDGIVNILKNCLDIANLKESEVAPMSLWYAIVLMMTDETLQRAQLKFCQEDLNKNNVVPENLLVYMKSKMKPVLLYDLDDTTTVDYEYHCYITDTDTSDNGGWMFPEHPITENISCCPKYVLSYSAYVLKETFQCPLCMSTMPKSNMMFVKSKTVLENEIRLSQGIREKPIMNLPIYDKRNHTVVEIGESLYKSDSDHTLTKLDNLDFNVQSYQINAPTINDALGNRHIEITTQAEFNATVHSKYPFLKDLDMTGACLAGGFCRSVLLKQQLKDLDFFFYGYGESEEDHQKYLFNFKNLLNNICMKVKEWNPETKFLMMYKPLFNVFEIVCVRDPTNFLQQDYSLDNFKQYDFKSLHRFDKHTIIDPESGKIYRRKDKWGSDEEDTSFTDIENKDFSNYFEDGDVNGVKMLLRIQFILSKYKTKTDILAGFDLYPCRVLYDGNTTYFTHKAFQAYKYMINIVNENNFSDLYDHRLSKYFVYGFSIVLPELDIQKVQVHYDLKISGLSFKVSNVNDKLITVEKDSHIKKLLDSLQSVEQKNLDKGKALYKSSLFCSLVSLLRYVKINNVNYLFTENIVLPDENYQMKFRESTSQIHFVNKIDSRKPGQDLYGYCRVNPNIQLLDEDDEEETPSQSPKKPVKRRKSSNSDEESDSDEETPPQSPNKQVKSSLVKQFVQSSDDEDTEEDTP